MADVDGGFRGCCCGNRGTGGTAAEHRIYLFIYFFFWVGGWIT